MNRSRTFTVAAILMVLASTAAFAQPFGLGLDADAEEVTLTGRIALSAGEVPTLTVGSDTYELRIPPSLSAEIEVQDRATVTVSGHVATFASRDLLGDESVMMVRTFSAGGTEWVATMAPRFAAGRSSMGGRAGGQRGSQMGGQRPYDDSGRFGGGPQTSPGTGTYGMPRR